jgi:hypothetical protein
MLHNTTRHRPLRSLKSKRPRGRQYVTLIAAFRCREGAVLCADTMETVDDFHTAVHKLEIVDDGHYRLAVAGTGNADLVDGFTYFLSLNVKGWQEPNLDEQTIGARIRGVLREYQENEVKLYPAGKSEKLTKFIVCVQPKAETGFSLWQIYGSTLVPVDDYALMGVGSTLYMHELKALYNANNVVSDGKAVNRFGMIPALLLGIHLFSFAKDTSAYIGRETEAVFVFDGGSMKPVDSTDMRILEERVREFGGAIGGIILKCPDTTNHDADVREYLLNFTDRIMEMRERLALQGAESSSSIYVKEQSFGADPFLHVPGTSIITRDDETGEVTITHKGVPAKKKGRKAGKSKTRIEKW